MWREAFAIAHQLGVESGEVDWMAGEVVGMFFFPVFCFMKVVFDWFCIEELVDLRRYDEAARVLLDYSKVRIFC